LPDLGAFSDVLRRPTGTALLRSVPEFDDETLGSACEPHGISSLIGVLSVWHGRSRLPDRQDIHDFSLALLADHVTVPLLSNGKRPVRIAPRIHRQLNGLVD